MKEEDLSGISLVLDKIVCFLSNTDNDKRVIEKGDYRIEVAPAAKF